MKRRLRSYLGPLFALLLALTGQSMAVARGMPGAAGEIILCTGQGIVAVAIDENGQPVDKPHVCPDFALSLFAFAATASGAPARPLGRAEKLAPPRLRSSDPAPEIAPSARGPPAFS